jgi:hypothetical protein
MAARGRTLRAFWNNCGQGCGSDAAREVDLRKAGLIWSDEVRGVEGNFFGLIDEFGNTIQFRFEAGIPDDVDDAGHLRIVLMDFPKPERRGSYTAVVTIGEVHGLIEQAFREGVDHHKFGRRVRFSPW